MFKTYGVLIINAGSRYVKKLIEQNNFIENEDY